MRRGGCDPRTTWTIPSSFTRRGRAPADAPRPYGKARTRTGERKVPVSDLLRPVLDRLKAFTQCSILLTGPDGQPLAYETWRGHLAPAAEKVGLGGTHHLRHFAASLWIKAGANPLRVMKMGGWWSLDMVSQRYGYLWPNDIADLGPRIQTAWRELADAER